MPAIYSFKRQINELGYEWVPGKLWNTLDGTRFDNLPRPQWLVREPWNASGADTPRLLLRPIGTIAQRRHRIIEPTEMDPALFRNFAAIDPTPASIVEFANTYGELWDSPGGEPFHEWEYEIRSMRFLIELGEALTKDERTVITRYFRYEKVGRTILPYPKDILDYRPFSSFEVVEPICKIAFPLALKEPPPRAAASYLFEAINRRLSAIGIQLGLARVKHNARLAIRPKTLLGALWLQFARAISDQRQYQACEACGTYLELSPESGRPDKRYCDNACRNRGLRRRQKLSREMRQAGSSLREIIKATKSDLKTVKKWVAEVKE